MAVIIFLAGGFVITLVIRLIIGWQRLSPKWPATIMGGLAGIPVLLVSLGEGTRLPAGMFLSGLWILFMYVAWGHTLGWVFQVLDGMPAEGEASANTGRRKFLYRLGGITAGITILGAGIGAMISKEETDEGSRWSTGHPLPNAASDMEPAPGTRPEFTSLEKHYRIDINTMPPDIRGDKWRLQITGLVENDLRLALDEIKNHKVMHQFVTLECISNYIAGDLISTTRWTGVSLQDLLPGFGLRDGAAFLAITAADGFREFVSLEDIRNDKRIMLCYAWDGVPLTRKHGFPLRIYIPDHYGMKQPKWIEKIEITAENGDGYWVKRGWDREARIRATSVIDTVAADHVYTDEQGVRRIPVGGIAFAGARGISKVQLKTDDGLWQEARLRPPLSETTWVIWRIDIPYAQGRHRFTVRCYEGDGTPQIEKVSKPHPSGATGLHSVEKIV